MNRSSVALTFLWILLMGIVVVLCVAAASQAQQCGAGGCGMPQSPYGGMWAAAQPPPQQQLSQAQFCPGIIRVNVGPGWVTGSIVAERDGHSYILTCWHVLMDGGASRIVLIDGRSIAAELIESDAVNDWAVFRTTALGIAPLKTILDEDTDLQVGEAVTVYGYARMKQFSYDNGRVVRNVSFDKGKTYLGVEVSCRVVDGMSGGPLLARDNRIVGVISAAEGTAFGPCLWRFRTALRRIIFGPRLVPVTPRPDATAPPPVDPPTAADSPCIGIDVLRAEITSLRSRLAKLEAAGPRLLVGPEGPAGPPGLPGRNGELVPIPIDAVAAAVLQKLPPIHVEVIVLDKPDASRPPLNEPIYDAAGKRIGTLMDRSDVYLGGVLPLRLVPVQPGGK